MIGLKDSGERSMAQHTRLPVGFEQVLSDFRLHLELDAGVSIDELDTNAALLLVDLCEFLNLPYVGVLGKPGRFRVQNMLDGRPERKER